MRDVFLWAADHPWTAFILMCIGNLLANVVYNGTKSIVRKSR